MAPTTALVMDNLNEQPPRDEYVAVWIPPPAYDDFEDVYAQWCAADKAKQDMAAIERDYKVAEKELKEAREVLDGMKKKRCGPPESQTVA
jgi:flagellar motility protein MotE (MotC chaperone)